MRENYRKSIKLLHGCRKGGGAENQVLYLNNMGCNHFRMGKHNAAAFYFLKALRENNELQVDSKSAVGGQITLVSYPLVGVPRSPGHVDGLGGPWKH